MLIYQHLSSSLTSRNFSNLVVYLYVLFNKQEAECEKTMMDTKYDADTKIADSQRQFEMLKAGFEAEVNTKVSHMYMELNILRRRGQVLDWNPNI